MEKRFRLVALAIVAFVVAFFAIDASWTRRSGGAESGLAHPQDPALGEGVATAQLAGAPERKAVAPKERLGPQPGKEALPGRRILKERGLLDEGFRLTSSMLADFDRWCFQMIGTKQALIAADGEWLSKAAGQPVDEILRVQNRRTSNLLAVENYSLFANLVRSGDYILSAKPFAPESTDEEAVYLVKELSLQGKKLKLYCAWLIADHPQQKALRGLQSSGRGRRRLASVKRGVERWNAQSLSTRKEIYQQQRRAAAGMRRMLAKLAGGKPWSQADRDEVSRLQSLQIDWISTLHIDPKTLRARGGKR